MKFLVLKDGQVGFLEADKFQGPPGKDAIQYTIAQLRGPPGKDAPQYTIAQLRGPPGKDAVTYSIDQLRGPKGDPGRDAIQYSIDQLRGLPGRDAIQYSIDQLRGPKGDPGDPANLPPTENIGDVLTVTANGWKAMPLPVLGGIGYRVRWNSIEARVKALEAGGGGSALQILDEGISLDTAVTSINFTGVGVTATNVGHAITVNIPLTTGPQGDPGTNGTNGSDGAFGGAVTFEFIVGSGSGDVDPTSGHLAFNNGLAGAANSTAIRVSDFDVNGTDVTAALILFDDSTATPAGYLRIVEKNDPTKWILFKNGAVTTGSGGGGPGYQDILVTNISQSATGPFTGGDHLLLTWQRTGDNGTNGTNGTNGINGTNGTNGNTITVKDEGSNLTTAPTSMNFVGSGVTATAVGNDVTVTIPGAAATPIIPKFAATNNTTQSFTTGVSTKVNLQVETFDTNNNFATSTFTATIAGYYQFNGIVRVTSGSSNVTNATAALYVNGVQTIRGTGQSADTAFAAHAGIVSALLFLNIGDTVELWGNGTGTSPVFDFSGSAGAQCFFNGFFVGAGNN